MLHNSGPYGPNDVPINMGVPVNMTQMPNPMNLGNNLGNLAKIPQQTPQTATPHYSIPDYSSFGHPPLNVGHSMSPFGNYHHLNFQTSYGHPNPNLTHDMVSNSVQNTLPMNLNTSSDHGPNLMNYHSFEGNKLENNSYRENFNRKTPLNIPQIHTKAFHKHGMESNYGQFNIQENPNQDLKMPEKTLMDSDRRKSLENTVKLIENILINSTPKDKFKKLNSTEPCDDRTVFTTSIDEDQRKRNIKVLSTATDNTRDSQSNLSEKTDRIDENKAEPTTKQIYSKIDIKDSVNNLNSDQIIDLKSGSSINVIDNTKTLTKHNDISEKTNNTKLSDDVTKESNSTNIQSEIHCEPIRRCLINRILPDNPTDDETDSEKEVITEINIKKEIDDTVEVKVEPVEPQVDTDSVFLRDTNGTLRDDIEADAFIIEENSIAQAREDLTNGSKPKTYYECPHCNLLFGHPKWFLIHTKWHTFGLTNEKKLELAKEKELKKSMKKEARIIERLNSKEIKEVKDGAESDTHPCKDCDKVFAVKSSLKNHRQKYHPTRVRQCKVCNASVVGWMALRAHMATHTGGGGYQCPECPKRFKYAHSLAKHKDTHLEKTHGCSQCSKKFGSNALLKMHMKCHERAARGAVFRCSYCGKGFFESYNLQVHERTHRNERPFTCDICKTSFGTNSSLKRHLKVSHSTSKPFPCPTCHRCFASATTRARHTSRVHGDPASFPQACPQCPRRYKALKELHKHMSKAHPDRQE